MGLMLSVLIVCVGVVELLNFCRNFTRNFVSTSTQTTLDDIAIRYRQDLRKCLTIESEDIELEFVEPPSNNRYLLTERKTPSPRRFLVENQSESLDLPHLIVEKQHGTRYSIENRDRSKSPIPLPGKFIVEDRSRSPSPIPPENLTIRRSSSPYPGLVLSVPRNSICGEFLEHQTKVEEVDEDVSKSPTPDKIDVMSESRHDTVDYWNNKMLLPPKPKSRSHSPCNRKTKHKSVSPMPLGKNCLTRRKSKSESGDIENAGLETSRNHTDDVTSSSSNTTAKTLTEAAAVLKRGEFSGTNQRSGEPFWVKNSTC